MTEHDGRDGEQVEGEDLDGGAASEPTVVLPEPEGEVTISLPPTPAGDVEVGEGEGIEPTVVLPGELAPDVEEGTEPTVALPEDLAEDLGDGSEPAAPLPEGQDGDPGEVPAMVDQAVVEASTAGMFAGPMRILTWIVAAGWLVLAGFGFVAMSPPGGWIVGAVASLGGAVTAWLGWTMVVRWDADGIRLPGRGPTPWERIDEVALHSGVLSVPHVEMHTRRSIETVPLDALAWFGKRGASLRLAQQVADHADAGEVRVVGRGRHRGTRLSSG